MKAPRTPQAPISSVGPETLLAAYSEQRKALKKYFMRRLRCAETAEDLTQETWLKANQNSSVAAAIVNPRAYLFAMAANLATDYLRVEARRSELRGEYGDLLWQGIDNRTPEQQVIAQDELEHLHNAVSELQPLSRKIFFLSRFSGLTYQEIASQLGVSTTTVGNHMRLVLDYLSEALDNDSDE